MGRFSLKRHEKILKSTGFIAVYKKGVKKESSHLKVALLANGLAWSRLGITVSKKVGNSVQRNYWKRCVREYFRLRKFELPAATDIVFTIKPGSAHLKYAEIAAELDGLFRLDDHRLNAHI